MTGFGASGIEDGAVETRRTNGTEEGGFEARKRRLEAIEPGDRQIGKKEFAELAEGCEEIEEFQRAVGPYAPLTERRRALVNHKKPKFQELQPGLMDYCSSLAETVKALGRNRVRRAAKKGKQTAKTARTKLKKEMKKKTVRRGECSRSVSVTFSERNGVSTLFQATEVTEEVSRSA